MQPLGLVIGHWVWSGGQTVGQMPGHWVPSVPIGPRILHYLFHFQFIFLLEFAKIKKVKYCISLYKDVSKMKCTNWLLHYFTTLSGHILANYISIFHKTEVFMNILRCQTCPNLNWIKTTR